MNRVAEAAVHNSKAASDKRTRKSTRRRKSNSERKNNSMRKNKIMSKIEADINSMSKNEHAMLEGDGTRANIILFTHGHGNNNNHNGSIIETISRSCAGTQALYVLPRASIKSCVDNTNAKLEH